MSTDDKKKRTPEETLRAIEAQEMADELARIKSLTDDEVAAEIRKEGGDPDAIGRRAVEHVAKLEAKRKRAAWQGKALDRLRRAHETLSRPGPHKTRGLSREELLARIDAARKDPRMREPIAIAFRDKKLETSSEAELEAVLDAIEDLARLAESLE